MIVYSMFADELDVAEEVAEARDADRPDQGTDDVVGDEVRCCISPTPATIGANVRTIGTKRARKIVFGPFFSRKVWALPTWPA